MSNWYQAVVSHAVITAEQAQEKGAAIAAWLIGEEIIDDQQCGGCQGEGLCYKPGRHFMRACGGIESAASNGNFADFSGMRMNGMRLAAGPTVIVNASGAFDPVPCPACAEPVSNDEFASAGGKWLKGEAEALSCLHCGTASALPLWTDPDLGFVMLAFEFSNWSPLSEAFVDEIGKRLGHRVSVIEGNS